MKEFIKKITFPNGFGTLSIDNTEKHHINIWFDEKDESNVVMIPRNKIPILITSLMALHRQTSPTLIKMYIKDNCHKKAKAIAKDLLMTDAEFKYFCRRHGIRLNDHRQKNDNKRRIKS